MIYRFRVILDAQEDVFRDIEIEGETTFEDFHNTITQAFGFGGQEMASFYVSNHLWEQGEEISLFNMNDDGEETLMMSETSLNTILNEDQTRLIYVYDFLSMWTFMIELAEIAEYQEGQTYPNLLFAHGQIPEEAPDKTFIAESSEGEDFDEDYDLDAEDYEDLNFDENWN